MSGLIEVIDDGCRLRFSFPDMMSYSGPGSPAGVALAFKAMELGFCLLSPEGPPDRRGIAIETAFQGPGARDGFELVTRCLTERRYVVDTGLARPERGATLAPFVFRLRYQDRCSTLLVRPGQVSDEFMALARRHDRTPDDDRHFSDLKQALADHLMGQSPDHAFEVDGSDPSPPRA